MCTRFFCLILIITFTVKYTKGIKFKRKILSVGFPYYKILMILGTCEDKILFIDEKVWGAVKYNRIIDIYYNSKKSDVKVSKAEITIVLNNTDCYAASESGIGYTEFSATLYLPTNIGVMFHSIKLFTCSQFETKKEHHYEENLSRSSETEQFLD